MDILMDKPVKIRKDRKCWGCTRGFKKGSTLQCVKAAGEGTVTSTYYCDTCIQYMNDYYEPGDEVGYGDCLEDRESWEVTRKDVEGE
ncbi:hypothetical protein Bcp1_036 [Bacillus phage Bcp1]|uniref:Uncharacterized protein n=1 Tax=Bacillus phage Bcp1 TaxID=584892 RepID=X2JN35_9CAUD|nr:hypothetical protein Bcp1_036 [Bacillus phage Bcp1]AHN66513.1 hypothetical protein Bcp1_036 [Bacillus phage Bcp1]